MVHAADPALYPAAQCATFWFGWDDFARSSTLLDRTPGDLALAEAFRAEAYRQTTSGVAGGDAFVATAASDDASGRRGHLWPPASAAT